MQHQQILRCCDGSPVEGDCSIRWPNKIGSQYLQTLHFVVCNVAALARDFACSAFNTKNFYVIKYFNDILVCAVEFAVWF